MIKKSCSILVIFVGLLVFSGMVGANSDDINSVQAYSHLPFFPGELLVKFKQGVPLQKREAIHVNLISLK